jgi:hypothetical protein
MRFPHLDTFADPWLRIYTLHTRNTAVMMVFLIEFITSALVVIRAAILSVTNRQRCLSARSERNDPKRPRALPYSLTGTAAVIAGKRMSSIAENRSSSQPDQYLRTEYPLFSADQVIKCLLMFPHNRSLIFKVSSRDISVGIETDYGAERPEFDSGHE